MTHSPIIETDRLILRAPVPNDLPAYAAFYAISEVTVGGYRGNRSDAEIAAVLDRDIAHWKAKGFGMFLVSSKADETFYGGTGLMHPDDWPSHELTWWMMPAARRLGIATEASVAVIAWGYDVLGWPRVETHMRDENVPARHLALRLGGIVNRRETFPDGVTRDVFVLPRQVAA